YLRERADNNSLTLAVGRLAQYRPAARREAGGKVARVGARSGPDLIKCGRQFPSFFLFVEARDDQTELHLTVTLTTLAVWPPTINTTSTSPCPTRVRGISTLA